MSQARAEREQRQITIVRALREAIAEEMRRDPRVYCIGEDIGIPGGFGGAFSVTWGLEREFGRERVRDTPVSEAAIVGCAVGSAMTGLRPIADFQYGDFAFCAMDQIVNQAAKMCYISGGKVAVPMVLRVPVGATTRGAQHAQSLEAWFMHTPGLKVACPSSPYDAKGLLKTAVRDDNPVLFLEHKLLYGTEGVRREDRAVTLLEQVPRQEYLIPFGQARIRREGKHVTVLANLLMVYRALEAAEEVAAEGIEVEVLDPRTLVPFDWEALFVSLRKTGRLLIVEEDNRRGGWGAEIAATLAEQAMHLLKAPIARLAAPDTPVPFAPVMENFYVPSRQQVAAAIRALAANGGR